MEILSFLLLCGIFFIGFKLLIILLKGTAFVISLPFIILASVLTPLFLILIFPVVLLSGVASLFLIPLGILGHFLPLILIGVGIYLLARR